MGFTAVMAPSPEAEIIREIEELIRKLASCSPTPLNTAHALD